MTIPEIIQQQLLHTNKAIVWSWGVSKWYELSANALALRVSCAIPRWICLHRAG